MPTWLSKALNQLIDHKPDELIGFLVITLFVAVAASGLFRLLSRGRSDVSLLLTVLVMVACIVSMLTAGVYERYRLEQARRQLGAQHGPPGLRSVGQFPSTDALAIRLLHEFDANHDERLSAEEAAAGAAEFIKQAAADTKSDTDPSSGLDVNQLRRALRQRMGLPRGPGLGGPVPEGPGLGRSR